MRHKPVNSPYLVPYDGTFRVRDAPTAPPHGGPSKKEAEAELAELVERMGNLQRLLYASDHHAILLVFQAMDAAGKDSTIRAVLSGIDPSGCQVASFKAPSTEEIDHDFLWRHYKALPERGRIGVFNRSWYEEVLVVKVHPEFLARQRLPHVPDDVFEERYQSIHDAERHLRRNGTIVLKFWLNVSEDEQKRRFLSRLDDPTKNWKFEAGDLAERDRWGDYMDAYEKALNATSREHAPWYAIPADDKRFMRLQVAKIVVALLESLDLRYPEPEASERARLAELRALLDPVPADAEAPAPKEKGKKKDKEKGEEKDEKKGKKKKK